MATQGRASVAGRYPIYKAAFAAYTHMTFLSLLPTHMFEGSKFMWFSVVETLALATGISVALLGGMPGSATPEYSDRIMEIYLSKGKMHHERNYGIDFLRLVLMFMVCMLHTLGQGGILTTSVLGTIGYKVYWLIEIISYCAVDGFAVISGFVASDKPRNFEILVNMWFQAFFYSFVLTVILTFLGFNNKCSFADILKCAFPVINNKFWYFTSYFGLFFIIPVLNNYFFSISENNAKRILLIILFLFSAIGTLSDPFILYGGYSLIWLLVLYSTGILIKIIRLFEKQSNQVLLIYWGLSIAITWLIFVYFGDSHLVSYVSPTILINSIIMVVLFSRISMKGRIIKKISPFVFGIYLFQMNQVIWNKIFGSFSWIVGKSLYFGLPLVFASASVIFLLGLVIEWGRDRLTKALCIPRLSNWIVKKAACALEQLSVFLN